jgi:hypothetical protein
MNRLFPLLTLSALCASQFAVPANAIPGPDLQLVSAVLGSPIAQPQLNDPMLKRAIELLKEQQIKIERPKKPNKPDSPIGIRRPDKRLILGGPEVFPM